MGRPIKDRYFGGLNQPYTAYASKGKSGVGGEGIASLSVWPNGTGTNFSQGVTAIVTAPQISNGVTAIVTPVINSAGTLTNLTIVNGGTGYTSTSGVIVNLIKPAAQSATLTANATSTNQLSLSGVNGIYVGMYATGTNLTGLTYRVNSISGNTVTLSNNVTATVVAGTVVNFSDTGTGITITATNIILTKTQGIQTINFTAFLATSTSVINVGQTSTSAIGNGDVIKQEGSRSYLVANAQGRGRCKLATTSTLLPGTMSIIATDFGGAQYFINKLTSRRAHLVQYQLNGASKYLINFESTGTTAVAKWSTLSNTAITGTNIVSIATTV